MTDQKELDHALDQFRQATASGAPREFASQLAARLPAPLNPLPFLALISLSGAAASIIFTLTIIEHKKNTPPPLPEFTSHQTTRLFPSP